MRPAILLAVFVLGLGAGLWLSAAQHARQERDLLQAQEQRRFEIDAAEAARLAAEAARQSRMSEIEEAAHASPVTVPVALPADRVRRLRAIR